MKFVTVLVQQKLNKAFGNKLEKIIATNQSIEISK